MKVTKIGRLRTALWELWREHRRSRTLPTSARFLFYELVARGVVSKVKTGARRPDQDVGDALTQLREDGLIPWADIVDETRSLEDYTGPESIAQSVLSAVEQARLDPWRGKAPLIITESRSLAGVLRSVAWEYRVQIASTNGQCGGFLYTEIGPALRAGQPVLYVGDLDFSGGHIERNTRGVLEHNFNPALEWERLALTEEQAKKYKLARIRKYDARDKKHHDAIETEALSQRIIGRVVRKRLTRLLPEPLETVLEREARQRDRLRRKIAR